MNTLTKILLPFFLFCVCITNAQINDFSYKREILDQNEMWQKITLPNDIFEQVKPSFEDFRIYGITPAKDTIEAAYVIKQTDGLAKFETINFKIINPSRNAQGSFYTLEVPKKALINTIDLEFEEKNFDWQVTLEGSQDQKNWFTIVENYRILSIDNAQTRFAYTNIKFPSSSYGYFRIHIKSKDKTSLKNASISYNTSSSSAYRNYAIVNLDKENDKEKNQSILEIELENKVPISLISLSAKESYDYYRPISIQYLYDSTQTPKGWIYSYKTIFNGTLNSFESNSYLVETLLAKKLKVIIENSDNSPLSIDSISIQGFEQQLIARFTTPARYFLVYGNSDAYRPSYDINPSFIPDSLTSLELGEPIKIKHLTSETQSPLFENMAWLWTIMGLLIVLLFWFSYSMLKKK